MTIAKASTVHRLPADFQKAISADPKALATWNATTPLAHNEWICWVTSGKKAETRGIRIKKGVSKLHGGMRRPCCWAGCPHRAKRGFTLIELLVVIAIIAIIASVVIASLNTARKKADDAFRKEQLHDLQIALEMYYGKHGSYPYGIAASAWSDPGRCGANWDNCDTTGSHGFPMDDLLNDGDLPQGLPLDPESLDGGGYLSGGYSVARGFIYCSGNPHSDCPSSTTTQTYILGTNLSNSPYPDSTFGNFIVGP